MSAQVKQRDYLFDNYKVLLMVFVVTSHFIDLCYRNIPFLYELKWFIVAFHMPAFIFITGYFSKKTCSFQKLVQKFLIPYIVYEILYYLLYTLVLGKEAELEIAYPKFSLWYILAVFIWKLLAPLIVKIPGHMIMSVTSGLLMGLSDMTDNLWSIPRIVVFFPFFLAGLHFDASMLEKLRSHMGKIISGSFIVLFVVFLFTDKLHHTLPPFIFYGRYNYNTMDMGPLEGIIIRLGCYGISFLLTFSIAAVMPAGKTCYSYIGTRTMAVYLFHGLVYSCFKHQKRLLAGVDTWMEAVVLLGFCAALVWVFSHKYFTRFTDFVAGSREQNIQLPRIPFYPFRGYTRD